VPSLDIVPTVELPPATPLTVQLTVLSVAFATLAAKDCVPATCTLAVAGHTATRTAAVVVEQDATVADVGLNTIFEVSERPASSVTAT
jgi:hypothetical protein